MNAAQHVSPAWPCDDDWDWSLFVDLQIDRGVNDDRPLPFMVDPPNERRVGGKVLRFSGNTLIAFTPWKDNPVPDGQVQLCFGRKVLTASEATIWEVMRLGNPRKGSMALARWLVRAFEKAQARRLGTTPMLPTRIAPAAVGPFLEAVARLIVDKDLLGLSTTSLGETATGRQEAPCR